MEYILFLITIQGPFVYLIWKLFSLSGKKNQELLKVMQDQQRHVANFLDTIRLSVEKISEDLYGSGKVNSRLFDIEKKISNLKKNLKDVELYTGLSTNYSSKEKDESSSKTRSFI